MNSPLDKGRYIGAAITDLVISYDLFNQRLERLMKPLGLNMTQMSLLSHFARNGEKPFTISYLVSVMAINQSGLTKAVKSMVEKGWLSKQADESDGRVQWLTLTSKGRDALMQAQQATYPTLLEGFACFDEEGLKAFAEQLQALKRNLDSTRP